MIFKQQKLVKSQIRKWITLFTLSSLVIAFIISLRFYQTQGFPDTPLGTMFGLSHSIGHIGLLCFIFAIPLYLFYLLRLPFTLIKAIAVVLSGAALTFLLADTFIYQQYRFHINAVVWELFVTGGSEIISFPLLMWAQIILITLTIFSIQYGIATFLTQFIAKNKTAPPYTYWLVPSCLIIANFIHIWGDALFVKDITKQARYLPLAQPATAKRLMAKFDLVDIEAHKQKALLASKHNKGSIHYPQDSISIDENTEKPDILIILIDSWRADSFTPEITPNISTFSKISSQYNNHHSGSNNTRHGMFSFFYGLNGHYWEAILQEQKGPVLFEILKDTGYAMQTFSSAKLTMPEFDQTLFSDIKSLRTHSKGETSWQRDIDATNDYLTWVNQQKQPTISTIIYDAAHGFSYPLDKEKPFLPSLDNPEFLSLSDDYDATPFFNLYRNSLFFIDELIGKVLKNTESTLKNTIVIISSDHGKEFNDSKQGYWGHNSNYSDYQTKVPLLIHWPNKKVEQYNQLTSHFDIVPTLLKGVFDVNNDTLDYSNGFSMFDGNFKREHITVGRTGFFAIKSEELTYEVDRKGHFTVFNKEYQLQKDAKLDAKLMQTSLQELARFYKPKLSN